MNGAVCLFIASHLSHRGSAPHSTSYGELGELLRPWDFVKLPASSFPAMEQLLSQPMPGNVSLEDALRQLQQDGMPPAASLVAGCLTACVLAQPVRFRRPMHFAHARCAAIGRFGYRFTR